MAKLLKPDNNEQLSDLTQLVKQSQQASEIAPLDRLSILAAQNPDQVPGMNLPNFEKINPHLHQSITKNIGPIDLFGGDLTCLLGNNPEEHEVIRRELTRDMIDDESVKQQIPKDCPNVEVI